ncbi:MAG: methyltransferase domain-containing protein [Coleofasciculaceae cyanobacterium]
MQLHRILLLFISGLSAGSLLLTGCAQQESLTSQTQQAQPDVQSATPTADTQTPQREPDVVYVPTPEVVVEKMLELAKVGKNDILYDLGSGDGRIPITAAKKFGTQGVGVEIRPDLIQEAQQNAREANVSDRVQFLQQDLFQTDISKATVVTLYLLPELNVKLRPKLFEELKPGTRIVSHDFNMGDWQPEQTVQVQGPDRVHTVYSWVIPEKAPENLR